MISPLSRAIASNKPEQDLRREIRPVLVTDGIVFGDGAARRMLVTLGALDQSGM